MTDITALAQELYKMVNQQHVPEEVSKSDLSTMIVEAIKDLYVISGKAFTWADDKVSYDQAGIPITFEDTLVQDEQRWVLCKAQIAFYKWVQASVDDQVSYTTDAWASTHGDKPYEHLGSTIDRLEIELARIWHAMIRYNLL